VPTRLASPLLLLFFLELVVHPTQVLYSPHSDILAEHIPARHFLVRSWHQTGELPLWCPHQFGGGPFVHDIQVAIFYPPHLVFFLIPEDWVGIALSWLIVLHVLIAGLGMYAYAKHQGLNEAGSRRAMLCAYQPNRVVVNVEDGPPGFLVLTDVWYPVWTCTVDGSSRPIHRANFLFRAVEMPAGQHEVVFAFAPESSRQGGLISLATLGLVGGVLLVGAYRKFRGRAFV
jgi:hypothetical protein